MTSMPCAHSHIYFATLKFVRCRIVVSPWFIPCQRHIGSHIDASLLCQHSSLMLRHTTRQFPLDLVILYAVYFFLALPGLRFVVFVAVSDQLLQPFNASIFGLLSLLLFLLSPSIHLMWHVLLLPVQSCTMSQA